MEPILYTIYKKEAVPALKETLGIKNVMDVPKIKKITINVGFGRNHKDKAFIENVEKTLRAISGQKPLTTKVKRSIANFKVREGADVGMAVTLRGRAMYEFLYRLIHLTFPRVRDFRGISAKGFDRQGNYSFGFKEHIAFPEITAENLDKIHGLQVVINTTATNKVAGITLLEKLGFPFNDAEAQKKRK